MKTFKCLYVAEEEMVSRDQFDQECGDQEAESAKEAVCLFIEDIWPDYCEEHPSFVVILEGDLLFRYEVTCEVTHKFTATELI